jgi:hypothetical protein
MLFEHTPGGGSLAIRGLGLNLPPWHIVPSSTLASNCGTAEPAGAAVIIRTAKRGG